MLLSCAKMIHKFTHLIARDCPDLDPDDIRGDLWLLAVETERRWKAGSGKFSSYLHRRLTWYRKDMQKARVYRVRFPMHLLATVEETMPPVERGFDTLCQEAERYLRVEEIEVFRLMLNTSPEFVSKVKTATCGEQLCYAKLLQMHPRKVSRVVSKIREVVKAVIEDIGEQHDPCWE